jgi:hypothetical protein
LLPALSVSNAVGQVRLTWPLRKAAPLGGIVIDYIKKPSGK